MHEIVPDEDLQEMLILRGKRAFFDPVLYYRVRQAHYLDAFEKYCKEQQLDFTTKNTTAGEFDTHAYVEKMTARREALNRFIRQKPFIVVLDDRFFILTFLDEMEPHDLKIDEVTATEMADTVNGLTEKRGAIEAVKSWFRSAIAAIRG